MLITGKDSFPDEPGQHNRKHYIAVKSLSRLLVKKDTKHMTVQHHCMNCLHEFPTDVSRDNHESYCIANDAVRIEMPTKKPYVRYSEGQFQLKVSFAMYANFKSLLVKPTEEGIGIVNMHEPSGWCVKSEFAHGKVSNPINAYRGKDCIEKFCAHVVSEAKRLYVSYPEVPMVPLSPKQTAAHSHGRVCHICLRPFKEEDRKVRDHCHYTGKYKGAAHSNK